VNRSVRFALFFLLAVPGFACGQQAGGPTPVSNPANPTVSVGRIKLDVVVTDKAGKPVTGLQAQDFSLVDNKSSQKIVSFQAFDGANARPVPPTEVILLFDYVNQSVGDVAPERLEVQKFLREDNGHLAQPVSIFLLRDTGLQALRSPTTDGNLLADAVGKMESSFRVNGNATGANGDVEKYNESIHALSGITAYENKRPGRKLLLWIGPGWPLLDSPHFQQSNDTLKQYFKSIVEFSASLREARVNVYSVGIGSFHVQSARGGNSGNKQTNGEDGSTIAPDSLRAKFVEASDINSPVAYLDYLKGVKQFSRARAADLSVKVLATQNGGRVLGLDNGLQSQIDTCVQDASAFYTLSFDPSHAAQPDEYHDLKVQFDKPGLTAHTSTGYYSQP